MMEAIVIEQPGTLNVVRQAVRRPGSLEVTLLVELVGICATDLHIIGGHFPTARFPLVPGHEVVGTILERGSEVRAVDIGDRVVIDPAVPCEQCPPCRMLRPNLCEHRQAYGITLAGGAANFITLPARNCHRIPPAMSVQSAVLAEPLACVLHAFELAAPIPGRDVLLYGSGTIGLLSAYVARSQGAASISVVEPNPGRRNLAARLGVDACEATADELELEQWPLVVDATGVTAAIADGLGRLARGGTFLQIGVADPQQTVPISPYQLFARELRLVGSLTTRATFASAVGLLERGEIDVDVFLGKPFPLSRYSDAVEHARLGVTPKVTVEPEMRDQRVALLNARTPTR